MTAAIKTIFSRLDNLSSEMLGARARRDSDAIMKIAGETMGVLREALALEDKTIMGGLVRNVERIMSGIAIDVYLSNATPEQIADFESLFARANA